MVTDQRKHVKGLFPEHSAWPLRAPTRVGGNPPNPGTGRPGSGRLCPPACPFPDPVLRASWGGTRAAHRLVLQISACNVPPSCKASRATCPPPYGVQTPPPTSRAASQITNYAQTRCLCASPPPPQRKRAPLPNHAGRDRGSEARPTGGGHGRNSTPSGSEPNCRGHQAAWAPRLGPPPLVPWNGDNRRLPGRWLQSPFYLMARGPQKEAPSPLP